MPRTPALIPPGLTFMAAQTTRHDGVPMAFNNSIDTTTLGNLVPTHSRTVSHFFKADTAGPKTFNVRAWSENGGELFASTTFQVQTPRANLVPSGMGTSPATPTVAPGSSFSVSDTVQNLGQAASTSSKTRYYLSLDAVKGAGDRLLNGAHSVPALAAGTSHSATVQVGIPTSTPLAAYFLLVCADDQSSVDEENEADNCIASAGATVTVTRPDLVTSAASAPPTTAARGSKLQITDTAQNLGAIKTPSTRMRYYLSLDGVKGAGDRLLTGSRGVPGLAPGGSHSATATLTVPTATPVGTYFVLVCADDTNNVVETDEKNNCKASPGTMMVTP
jgi:subtilase family serine protease